MMNDKKGFTLTEILLAVMIVGLIGVALAALTTAASRESGVGRSKVMMRNNLSLALRTLRSDLNNATMIDYTAGVVSGTGLTKLIDLKKNRTSDGGVVMEQVFDTRGVKKSNPSEYVTYCFQPGTIKNNVEGVAILPIGATIGGRIYRSSGSSSYTACNTSSPLLLDNVKHISGGDYPVPLFCRGLACASSGTNPSEGSLLSVRIITELDSSPVTNDVIEEIFAVPNGY